MATATQFITFKRWKLREGRREREVLDLVRREIIPHYRKLPACRKLGPLHVNGTRAYLAVQYWESRDAHASTVSSGSYERWLREYEPILARWDELMEFDCEWEADDLLGDKGETRGV